MAFSKFWQNKKKTANIQNRTKNLKLAPHEELEAGLCSTW